MGRGRTKITQEQIAGYYAMSSHIIFVPEDSIRGIAPRTRVSLLGIQQPH